LLLKQNFYLNPHKFIICYISISRIRIELEIMIYPQPQMSTFKIFKIWIIIKIHSNLKIRFLNQIVDLTKFIIKFENHFQSCPGFQFGHSDPHSRKIKVRLCLVRLTFQNLNFKKFLIFDFTLAFNLNFRWINCVFSLSL